MEANKIVLKPHALADTSMVMILRASSTLGLFQLKAQTQLTLPSSRLPSFQLAIEFVVSSDSARDAEMQCQI